MRHTISEDAALPREVPTSGEGPSLPDGPHRLLKNCDIHTNDTLQKLEYSCSYIFDLDAATLSITASYTFQMP
jgi:hypothetical protein